MLQEIASALETIGIRAAYDDNATLTASGDLCGLKVEELAGQNGVRLEVCLMKNITRNKIALWNIIHHNNAFLPFGQFYISPTDEICFGLVLQQPEAFRPWFPQLVYYLLLVAERYYRMVQNDFSPQPFQESEIRMNALNLFRTELVAPENPGEDLPADAAAQVLARRAEEMVGENHVIPLSSTEFALTNTDFVVQLSIEQMTILRAENTPDSWFIGVKTEVGVMETTNDSLWVQFNRLNRESTFVGHSIKYVDRKPMVQLKSALPGLFLNRTEQLAAVVQAHLTTAPSLFEQLQQPYRIRNVVNYKLGL